MRRPISPTRDGNVTYWNRACVDFAGREPQLGQDRWCVTWKLYTMAGEPLAHDACPMAVAIKQQRIVRDAVAIAERPDGSRRAFTPYPTPLFDEDGALKGAVNMLIDVTAAARPRAARPGRPLPAAFARASPMAKQAGFSTTWPSVMRRPPPAYRRGDALGRQVSVPFSGRHRWG